MCAGWPMYSNSNHDDGYYVAVDQEWTRPFGNNPPHPELLHQGIMEHPRRLRADRSGVQ